MTKSLIPELIARRGSLALASVLACASAALSGCAAGTLAGVSPNSRTMSLQTLQAQVRPGMSEADVVAHIGRPTYWFPVSWQKQSVWNYRFAPPEGDCVVFQVSFAYGSDRVVEVGQGYDRACDGPDRS